MDYAERFWSKVDKHGPQGCWLWTAGRFHTGYGAFQLNGKAHGAHRIAYVLLRGPIPAGRELDHLCRVRHCVNPVHLEPVSSRKNILRGVGPAAINARRKRCEKGHPFERDGRQRICRVCRREYWRLWAAAKRNASPKAREEYLAYQRAQYRKRKREG